MKKQTLNEVQHFKKIAGLLKENEGMSGMTQVYDDAISYSREMTPELMFEDGELESAESLIQAEEEFAYLLKAAEVNPSSTLAYRRFFENAWGHAKQHGATDVEDFKAWFAETAVESPVYRAEVAKMGEMSEDANYESESGDTDAMGDTDATNIDEAGSVKGIKIEIPGNSYASDFGKAAAREVVESFGPREYRSFLEAFLNEFKKITGGV